MNGYLGKLLVVDLTSGKIEDEPLNENYVNQFIGGSGLAARYLYDLLDPGLDPLDPANPLFFITGPLTGTRAPMCGRHVICARSPLTGTWNESHAGGFVGAELRFAGYDGIIIRGSSPKPVCLWVQDGTAELRDAGHLWGRDTFETQAIIKEELGDPRVRVACIGPAGENQVLLANIIHDHARAAGRGGMGAVMGSKNLKAVAVRGHGRIPVADEERLKEVAREMIEIFKDDFLSDMLHATGTACAMDQLNYLGSLPSRYYTQGVFETDTLNGGYMADTILTGTSGCYGCVVACGRKVATSGGQVRFPRDRRP